MSTQFNQDESFRQLVLSIVTPELDRHDAEHEKGISPREWLTEGELADEWQCSSDTIKKYAMRDEDPLPYGMIGELRRYSRMDVREWLKAEGERDRRRRAEARKDSSHLQAVSE